MNCENIFCIYQRENQCILEKINLDIMGACTDCIYVNIGYEKLNKFKEKHLQNIEKRYQKDKAPLT